MRRTALVEFCHRFGRFPDDYLVLDCETTGLSPALDTIVQVGWAQVKNRKVLEIGSRYIAWEKSPAQSKDIVSWQKNYAALLEKTAHLGTPWPAWEAIQEYGGNAGHFFLDLTRTIKETPTIVGHNFAAFDLPFFRNVMSYCQVPVPEGFNRDNILDTGMLLKACLDSSPPHHNESRAQFNSRIGAQRTRTKWGLFAAGVREFGLDRLPGFEQLKAHDAGADVQITHQLLEAMREASCSCGADRTGPSAEGHSERCYAR